MKRIDTILFDLDGTLLPMEQGTFINTYLVLLAEYVSTMGHDAKPFIKALWEGTGAMLANDGTMHNRERFWETFCKLYGIDATALEEELSIFYTTRFNEMLALVLPKPPLRPLLDHLRSKGYGITLATNPVFPKVAVHARLNWIGLSPKDFDHITTYENSRYCKPQTGYFQDILSRLCKEPDQCLMIGNSPAEDMAAAKLGISVFLLTDHLDNVKDLPLEGYPQGGFAQMEALLRGLPQLA